MTNMNELINFYDRASYCIWGGIISVVIATVICIFSISIKVQKAKIKVLEEQIQKQDVMYTAERERMAKARDYYMFKYNHLQDSIENK